MKQDKNGVRTAQDLERKYNLSSIKKAVKQTEVGLTKINAELDGFVNSTMNAIENLQDQIDGNITTYYYSGVPTLLNLPASEWTTNEEKNRHLGDLYYDKDTGDAYRFYLDSETEVYGWIEIGDTDISEVLAIANEAKDTADGKRRVFTQTPTVPYDEGDLWINNQILYVCNTPKTSTQEFSSSDFIVATKYTDDTALNTFINGQYSTDISGLNTQIDKKAETWYQSVDPASEWTTVALKNEHVGDIWFNTATNKSYIYSSSYAWQESDGVPDSVYDKIDGKAQIFSSEPVPPYYVNDLYVQGSNGDIFVCKTERLTGSYRASDWAKASKYTDDTNLNNFVNVVYPATLDEMKNQIDAKITTWYYSGTPTLNNNPAINWTTEDLKSEHVGDLYYDQATGYSYRFQYGTNSYIWVRLLDSDISLALSLANAAQDTADGKRRIFTQTPTPPYDNGDLWINNEEIYICQISKGEEEVYNPNDFIIATKYTDNTFAEQINDRLTIVAGTVTTIQESNENLNIAFVRQQEVYDSLNNRVVSLEGVLEDMTFDFSTKGLAIGTTLDPNNSLLDNTGIRVYNYDKLNAIFNNKGSGIERLIVTGTAQIGYLKFEKGIKNGESVTKIFHLKQLIEDLEDLEV